MKVRKTFLWIPKSELKYIGILPDGIIYRGKKYRMMPTVTASVVMLMKYLEKNDEKNIQESFLKKESRGQCEIFNYSK